MSPSPGLHDGPASGTSSHRVSASSLASAHGPHPPAGETGGGGAGSKLGSVSFAHRDGGGGGSGGAPASNGRDSALAALLNASNRMSRVVRSQAQQAVASAAAAAQAAAEREGSPDLVESPSLPPAEVTTTEHIEPAAPGSTLGGPHRDDSLDLVVGQVRVLKSTRKNNNKDCLRTCVLCDRMCVRAYARDRVPARMHAYLRGRETAAGRTWVLSGWVVGVGASGISRGSLGARTVCKPCLRTLVRVLSVQWSPWVHLRAASASEPGSTCTSTSCHPPPNTHTHTRRLGGLSFHF